MTNDTWIPGITPHQMITDNTWIIYYPNTGEVMDEYRTWRDARQDHLQHKLNNPESQAEITTIGWYKTHILLA